MGPIGLDSGFAALSSAWKPVLSTPRDPGFFRGSFHIAVGGLADTYIDMTGWGKGNVFVNGHNVARYWSIGPQFTFYVPAGWLLEGANEIVVFETMDASANMSITMRQSHKVVGERDEPLNKMII